MNTRTSVTHNVEAQTETITDSLGHATTYVYDDDGHVVQTGASPVLSGPKWWAINGTPMEGQAKGLTL